MATQADGTVYINSSIDTDGFTAGGKEIEAAARRAAKTVKGIGDAARIALERQTAAFIKSNQLYAQQEQKVQDLQNKLEEMDGQTVETTAFKEIQKQIDTDTAKLNRLIQTQEEFLQTGGKTSSTAYQRRLMQIDELRNSIEYAKAEQDELLQSGQAYQPVDTSAVTDKLIAEQQRLQQMGEALNVSYDALKSKVEQYGGSIAGSAQKHGLLRKALSLVTGAAKKAGVAILALHKNTKKSNVSMGSGLKTILKYGLGIRSLYVLVNKIRNAVKEGFKNLAQYSDEVNASLSALKSSSTQLKNSLATAFAPIFTVIEPILTRFINLLSQAATYVGMFFAALTGKKTFTKAVAVQEDYAASLGDTADNAKKALKYLSGLDEIRTFTEDKEDSGGYQPPTPAEMFEEVPIDNKVLDFIDKLKNLLKPILDYAKKLKDVFMQGFWDGLGNWQYRWESIKDSIASIKDSLIDIWTDPKVLAEADRWAQSVSYTLGSIVGATASIGLTIATNLLGGIEKYLDENKDRIKDYLISMFDISTEINNIIAELSQSIAYIFEAFASDEGQQLTANTLGIILDTLMGISEIALKVARDVLNIFAKPIIDNADKFKTALEGILGFLAEITGTIKQGIDDTFDKLNEVYDEHFKPFFDSVAQGLSDLVGQFLDFWNNNVQPILDEWSADFDELWKSHIQPLLNNAAEFLGKVADLLKVLWENILQPFIAWFIANVLPKILPVIQAIWNMIVNFVGYIADAISSIITILGGIIDFLTGVFSGDWELAFHGLSDIVGGFVDLITGVIEGFLTLLSDLISAFFELIKAKVDLFSQAINDLTTKILEFIKNNVIGKLDEIKQEFQNFIESAKQKWNDGWDTFGEKVKSIVETIKNTIQAAFDWIQEKVDAIAEKLSSVKDSAKSIFSKGTSFVSSIFKKKYISIPDMPSIPVINTPQIPYLATGAVIPPNAPFMAMLGDQKRGNNLEMPENLLRKIVREESGNNKGFNGTIRIPLSINGRQVLEAIITEAQLQQMINGRNPFEMA